MSIIPRHIQRRFEQRWVAQFGSLVIPPVPKNVGLKGLPINVGSGERRRKVRRVELATSKCAVSGVSL